MTQKKSGQAKSAPKAEVLKDAELDQAQGGLLLNFEEIKVAKIYDKSSPKLD